MRPNVVQRVHRAIGARRILRTVGVAALAAAPAFSAAQAQGGVATKNDPRVGLRAGRFDAAIATKNLKLVSTSRKADTLDPSGLLPSALTFLNSDLAFRGNYVFQGNFSGLQIWDVSDPAKPVRKDVMPCATDQGDPSVYGNLLFMSSESTRNRLDCIAGNPRDTVSTERMRGIRIYDISDITHPKSVANVQTCRGSHTHTIVPDPNDKSVIYIYVSGSSGVRSPTELAGCSSGTTADNPASAQFRIEVIRVPLANPQDAAIVSSPRIFDSLAAVRAHGNPPGDTAGRGRGRGNGRGGAGAAGRGAGAGAAGAGAAGAGAGAPGAAGGRGGRGGPPTGPNQCHDITVYPELGLGAGACGGYGLLLDISDPKNPRRIGAVADSNFAFWHSATFSNDGSKLLFTDEWGGGQQPKCRAIDPLNWGGDAIFDLKDRKLTQRAYYKIPDVQTNQENCVAHNGSLLPVPGRDILSQGWYQGGVSVFDFTDASHPVEIAYFDRGPIDTTAMVMGGSWGAYYYNGYIYSSELNRGLDILELTPSAMLSQNEIDAAKLVHFDQFNPQSQPKIVWPPAFPVVRSYLDQLVRGHGLAAARTTALTRDLAAAEKMTGAARGAALNKIATSLDGDAAGAADAARVRMMAAAVRDLAGASR